MFLVTNRYWNENIAMPNRYSSVPTSNVGVFPRFIENDHELRMLCVPYKWMIIIVVAGLLRAGKFV